MENYTYLSDVEDVDKKTGTSTAKRFWGGSRAIKNSVGISNKSASNPERKFSDSDSSSYSSNCDAVWKSDPESDELELSSTVSRARCKVIFLYNMVTWYYLLTACSWRCKDEGPRTLFSYISPLLLMRNFRVAWYKVSKLERKDSQAITLAINCILKRFLLFSWFPPASKVRLSKFGIHWLGKKPGQHLRSR